jgi:two-component system NtrC family sensor kinase
MNYPEFREDMSRLLDNIEHGSVRINTVVSNLREFSRKKGEQAWRRVHIRELVQNGMTICAGELKKKVKSVEISLSEDLPMVLTDPGTVEQILINLLINAIQAADKGDSWIKVRAMVDPSRTDCVQIEVSDNGCGMDADVIHCIFEPFFSTKPPGTGTGLGLYVSQMLINQLGGEITVKSQPGIGSTFSIRLLIENNPGENGKGHTRE